MKHTYERYNHEVKQKIILDQRDFNIICHYWYLFLFKWTYTAIGVILAGLTLYFLFQTGQLYKKIWIKILVYLIDAVWILIVLLIISLFIY